MGISTSGKNKLGSDEPLYSLRNPLKIFVWKNSYDFRGAGQIGRAEKPEWKLEVSRFSRDEDVLYG